MTEPHRRQSFLDVQPSTAITRLRRDFLLHLAIAASAKRASLVMPALLTRPNNDTEAGLSRNRPGISREAQRIFAKKTSVSFRLAGRQLIY